jgi:hypothetical protein
MGFKPGSGELSDLDVDSGTLSVDETNNRVGLGTTSPKTALTVEGTITLKEQADADSDTPAYGQIWVNTATPCELYFTTDAGDDIQLTSGAATSLAADDITEGDAAVTIKTSSGAINIGHADNDEAINIGAGGTGAIAIGNATAGAVTIDSASPLSIDTAGAAANISHTATAGGDFTIAMDASANASLILSSAGTAGDALQITTTAGGIDISATGNAAGEDIDISSAASINLTATEDAENAIYLRANGGGDETIVIHSDQGTGEGTSNASIQLLSDAGGIDLTATGLTGVMTDGNSDAAVQLSALAGGIGIRTTSNLAGAIQIEADGGTSETIIIKADQGTSVTEGASSIQLLSDSGGVELKSTANLAKAIKLIADGGASETIYLQSDQGTGADSIELLSDAGGITISAGNTSHGVKLGTVSGAPITIGHTTSETTVGDNLTVTGDLAVNGDTSTFASANTTDPLIIIKNTTNDANGARLRFVKDKGAAGAANDVAGLIEFYADDASQDQVLFSEIKSQVKVHTNGQEGGKFTVSVAENDVTSTAGLVIEDGDADGELDVTIGAGAASLTTIAGDLDIPNGGFALGSDASGDMYYRNSSGVFTRIAVGSDNHVLTLNGAVPGWEAAAGGGGGAGANDLDHILHQQVFS